MLTVVVTAYECAATIEYVLDGIRWQKLPANMPVRILVGYENSADRTLEVLRAWEAKLPPEGSVSMQILMSPGQQIIHGRVTGRGNLFNVLKQVGETTFLAFCDCDDIWVDPNKIAKQIEVLKDQKVAAVYGQAAPQQRQFDGSKNLFWRGNRYCFSSLLTRGTSLQNSLKQHEELLQKTPVFDWMFAIALQQQGKLIHLADPMVAFGVQTDEDAGPVSSWHGDSVSAQKRYSAITAGQIAFSMSGISSASRVGAALLALRLYCGSKRFMRRAVRSSDPSR